MSITRAAARLAPLLEMLRRDDSWLIAVNADPDAIASAMALKRLFARRTRAVDIARINEIRRPDNLSMIHDLRIPLLPWREDLCSAYQCFALVDSQPSHNERFMSIPFNVVIDHHPLDPSQPVTAAYTDIRPDMGATSTILTDYLRALDIRPGARLATALQYGIRTDTASFTRKATAADLRAYQYLTKYADAAALTRIMQSEYLRSWLKYFSRAFASLHPVGKSGGYSFLGEVETPDLLVVIADFFSRVHGLAWIAVAGVCHEGDLSEGGKIVVIFRGDGRKDLGKFAHDRMNALGSAGGHRNMARAEFPLEVVEKGRQIEAYVYSLLH